MVEKDDERNEEPAPARRSRERLAELSGRIRALESGSRDAGRGPRSAAPRVPSGLAVLQGLERGVLHEFCGVGDERSGRSAAGGPEGGWAPPIALLVHLARRATRGAGAAAGVVWVGRRLWPYPGALLGDAELVDGDSVDGDVVEGASVEGGVVERDAVDGDALNGGSVNGGSVNGSHGAIRLVEREEGATGGDGAARGDLLARSLFVDPGPRALVWAADRALRCAGSAVVVIDGRGLDLGTTRRLQLAAEAGGALALVARPASDARRPSVAASRWRVERATTTADDAAPSFHLTPFKRRSTSTASDPASSLDREEVPGRTVPHTDPSIDGPEVPHEQGWPSCGPSGPPIDGSVCGTARPVCGTVRPSSPGTSSRSSDEGGSDTVRSAG